MSRRAAAAVGNPLKPPHTIPTASLPFLVSEKNMKEAQLNNISGKPLVQYSNGLEDQESLETHSFVYLAPPPSTSNNGSTNASLSPVLR